MPSRWCCSVSLIVVVGACSSSGEGDPQARAGAYEACPARSLAGEFVLKLDGEAMFTGVDRGEVLDGIDATRTAREVMKSGACRILQPAAATGAVTSPQPQDLGTVTMAGLKVPLTLLKIDNRYTNPPGVLPHPGFDEGASIVLQAMGGASGYGPFTLTGWGVAPLNTPAQPLVVESGKAATITWTAPALPGPTQVLINLGVNWHGAVDTWMECSAADTGTFTIPAATMTELFKHGVSGFPRVTLTRQSADTTTVKSGCVQFLVLSEVTRDVTVPGVVSCNEDSECSSGKTCQTDLSCK
jgi:hypothetical protein